MMVNYEEKEAFALPGILLLAGLVLLAILLLFTWPKALVGFGFLVVFGIVLLSSGFVVVQPNEAVVVIFLGNYIGSIRNSGFYFTVPFTARQKVSLKTTNFESKIMKVNDSSGSPVEVASAIVFKVTDTAKAIFGVDGFEKFVAIQSESTLRNIVARYPYDCVDENQYTLKAHADEVGEQLEKELQEKLSVCGVGVLSVRFTHLAYAPEVASLMLQRQQASAVITARKLIVHGAVGIATDAIRQLEDQGVKLDETAKAKLASNLLVVMVAEHGATPTVNVGNAME